LGKFKYFTVKISIMTLKARKTKRVPLSKKDDFTDDTRINSCGFEKCIQCGRCTASCPAAYVYGDYSPRNIMRELQLGELKKVAAGDDIWKCGQCYTCRSRCPRNNTAGMAIVALREYALKSGNAPENIKLVASTIKKNLYEKGVTFLPATLSDKMAKKFGKKTYSRHKNKLDKRAKIRYPADDARKEPVPECAMDEIRAIMRMTGYE
jgi:heterodisulfide reductase subunit C